MLLLRIKSGFTLIELIVVLLLISILATVVLPKINLSTFRQSGFAQQTMAAIRYAQKQAIGSGCQVVVSVTATDCTLQWNGLPSGLGCPVAPNQDIPNPATGLNNFCNNGTPESTSDLPAGIRFDNIGRPTATVGDLSINLGSRVITVEPETGFAHE